MAGTAHDTDWTYGYNTVGQLTNKIIAQTVNKYLKLHHLLIEFPLLTNMTPLEEPFWCLKKI